MLPSSPANRSGIYGGGAGGHYTPRPNAEASVSGVAESGTGKCDEKSHHGGGDEPDPWGGRMMVLVDANVLLDIVTNDPQWADWSADQLERSLKR